jgi:glycosyltransferase involved in cell wall biosynthesis
MSCAEPPTVGTTAGGLRYRFESPLPSELEVGDGNVLVLRGWTALPKGQHASHFEVELGGHRHFLPHSRDVRLDLGGAAQGGMPSGFWLPVPVPADLADTHSRLRLTLHTSDGERHHLSDREIAFVGRHPQDPGIRALTPRVVVCLTTYNPDPQLFRRQVRSLRQQTVTDWVCLVQDDCSRPHVFEEIRQICAEDPRFSLTRNPRNFGFYRNFEACLKRVPEGTEFVALCDQDDEWYPNKLAEGLARLTDDVQLVYSDMRLVDRDGRVLADTYWSTRRNNFSSFETLLVANTVTGAASVFRRSLLKKALPFPSDTGTMFHDHWMACVSMVAGRLDYIDKPLYDYTQHAGNVIGYCGFEAVGPARALLRHARELSRLVTSPHRLRQAVGGTMAVYYYEYRKLQLYRMILRLRFPGLEGEKLRAVDLFSDRLRNALQLSFGTHLSVLMRGDTTDMAEFKLGLGLALHKTLRPLVPTLSHWKHRLEGAVSVPRRVRQRLSEVKTTIPDRLYNDMKYGERIATMEQKIAPLRIEIDEQEPERINLVIPEINFAHFFGGYIGKFQLALKLARRGARVRLLLVDQGTFQRDDCRRMIAGYAGLEDFFSHVEVEPCEPRQKAIRMNPGDRLIATTWWTAHIAHAAAKELGRSRFLYLIQEYEPFTFPMGGWYALAVESYRFPHAALFSTQLLADYFTGAKAGVFADDASSRDHLAFQNAIVRTSPDWDAIARRKKRKLLFYCRPEEHAARNMFEVAASGLNRAINDGVFAEGDWELHGIGSLKGGFLSLSGGHTLRMIERVSFTEYARFLHEYDVGLSLMYTPHPSLVPLEMAGAGMLVVTNTCLNKTKASLAAISSNLIACPPVPEAVADGLRQAVATASDLERRRRGADVRWSTSWDDTFSDPTMAELERWLKES